MTLFTSKKSKDIKSIQDKLSDMDARIQRMNIQLDKVLNKQCLKDFENCPNKDCPNREL